MTYLEEDLDTPAMKQVVKLKASPGAIAEAMEDPEVFKQVARGDLYIEMTRLRRLANSNAVSFKARMEYANFLATMGDVQKPVRENNPLDKVPAINIYLPGSQQSTQLGATVAGEYTVSED